MSGEESRLRRIAKGEHPGPEKIPEAAEWALVEIRKLRERLAASQSREDRFAEVSTWACNYLRRDVPHEEEIRRSIEAVMRAKTEDTSIFKSDREAVKGGTRVPIEVAGYISQKIEDGFVILHVHGSEEMLKRAIRSLDVGARWNVEWVGAAYYYSDSPRPE